MDVSKDFPDEESCKQKFKEYREHIGIICSKCSCKKHYWKRDKEMWECKFCGHRTSLKSGTVMQKSKLSYRYWFIALYHLSFADKLLSAKELQRQIGHKRYQSIWYLMQKLQKMMASIEFEYIFGGNVDYNLEYVAKKQLGIQTTKLWSARNKKKKVLAMIETQTIKSIEGTLTRLSASGLNICVIQGFKRNTIIPIISSVSELKDTIPFVNVSNFLLKSMSFENDDKETNKSFQWIHFSINNAKKQIINTTQNVKPRFIKKYFEEFYNQFINKHKIEILFNRLLVGSVSYSWQLSNTIDRLKKVNLG